MARSTASVCGCSRTDPMQPTSPKTCLCGPSKSSRSFASQIVCARGCSPLPVTNALLEPSAEAASWLLIRSIWVPRLPQRAGRRLGWRKQTNLPSWYGMRRKAWRLRIVPCLISNSNAISMAPSWLKPSAFRMINFTKSPHVPWSVLNVR